LPGLPQGATPLRDLGWKIGSNVDAPAAALPYQMPDGSFGLALIDNLEDGTTISWLWHQETLSAEKSWLRIRRMNQTLNEDILLFLAQAPDKTWYLGAVTLPAQGAQLIGLIPVQNVDDVFVSVTLFSGHPWEFWLVEANTLRLYQWQSGTSALLWELPETPENAITVQMSAATDIITDGNPELWLRWWPRDMKGQWKDAVSLQQYCVNEWPGYLVIASFVPNAQVQDIDNDGVREFLVPNAADSPTGWELYDWDGEVYDYVSALPYPTGPLPQVPKLSELPPLSANLYFWKEDTAYRWPKAGGELEKVEKTDTPTCYAAAVAQEVVSWSPDCAYAVIKVPAAEEGYTLGLLNVAGGGVIEIPNTFTISGGYSTFDWNQASGFVLHARAGSNPGLYRVGLFDGLSETIFVLSTIDDDPFGVTDPFAFTDGSVGFAIQGSDNRLYPPPGIYHRALDGSLQMLADLPALGSRDPANASYGTVQWSGNGSAFLFRAPFYGGEQPPYSSLLVGTSDASFLLDINPILGKAANFVWR
jgi:hypothetical protein